jgi:chromosome segregation ATPase
MAEKGTREVTPRDLDVLDKAISSHEALGLFLYTTRGILGELGKLEKNYRDVKDGIKNGERYRDGLSQQIEAAQIELAKLRKEFAEKQQELTKLDAEIEAKYRTLENYSRAIDRITGAAA